MSKCECVHTDVSKCECVHLLKLLCVYLHVHIFKIAILDFSMKKIVKEVVAVLLEFQIKQRDKYVLILL